MVLHAIDGRRDEGVFDIGIDVRLGSELHADAVPGAETGQPGRRVGRDADDRDADGGKLVLPLREADNLVRADRRA